MRTSQTEIAVLGALSIEPMTGYALREQIREVLGHFWSESFGQIYPALAELERRGDVERHGSARRGASTFAITPSGLRRLLELLERPIQSVPPRNGLLLRLFFGRVLGPEACRRLVLDARREAERRLTEFEAIRREIETDDDHERERPFWLLTVTAGEQASRATVAWADEALASLEHVDASEPTSRKGDTR